MNARRDAVRRMEGVEDLTVTIRADVVTAAKDGGLDISAIVEDAMREATKEIRRAAWLEENREALAEQDV